jgi:bifunctional non-homologous end joining protein LigD
LAKERDLEGIVVKRLDSTYQPGGRSSAWHKIKIRRRQEFVVGGWLVGQGSLENRVGSLMVGVYDGPDLIMAGRVGSGLTDVERKRLESMLQPRTETPFKEVPALEKVPVWVEPTVVVEVAYGEWPVGAMLRHPTYCGIRPDRDPVDVVREDQI